MSSSRRRATARCAAWHPASPGAHATVARALPGRRDRDIAPYRHYTREWHPAPSPAPRCRAPPPCSVSVHLRRATLVSRCGRARCPHRAAAPHGVVRGLASRASLPGPVIARPCCALLPRTPPPRTSPPCHCPARHRTAITHAYYPGGAMVGRRASRLAPYRHYTREICPSRPPRAPSPRSPSPPGTACKTTENPFLRRNGFSF